MTKEEKQKAIDALKISVPIKALTQEEFNDYIQKLNKIMDWLEQEPTTKNNLGVDAVSRQAVIDMTGLSEWFDSSDSYNEFVIALSELPSVIPQQPKTGYIPIDDVMSVFDDFMCGEVDEEDTETFLKMLKDKAESEAEDGKVD